MRKRRERAKILKLRKDSPLVKNLKRKKRLIGQGNQAHKKIRTALIIGGGGMLGVYGGGVVIALERLGMSNVFDFLIGTSAGAADCAYFLAKQADFGLPVYTRYLASKKFINYFRFPQIVNIEYLDKVFKEKRPLDVEKIKKSRSKLLVTVTNVKTGKGEIIDASQSSVDIVQLIKASCAMPVFYNKKIKVNGSEYCDGAISLNLPLNYAINKLKATDILIISNYPLIFPRKSFSIPLEKAAAHLFLKNFSREFREAFLQRHLEQNKTLSLIRKHLETNSKVNIGVIYPRKLRIHALSRHRRRLLKTAQEAIEETRKIFS